MGQHDRQGIQDHSIERSVVGSDQTDAPPEDDTEGHSARWSDRDLKEDIEPVSAPATQVDEPQRSPSGSGAANDKPRSQSE